VIQAEIAFALQIKQYGVTVHFLRKNGSRNYGACGFLHLLLRLSDFTVQFSGWTATVPPRAPESAEHMPGTGLQHEMILPVPACRIGSARISGEGILHFGNGNVYYAGIPFSDRDRIDH
jgi:hypothetical protein